MPEKMAGAVTNAVLVFSVLLLCTQATYHIRPTSDSPCPHNDCLTLSEYASQNRSYSNSDNLTLVFLPGEHVLNTSIVFQLLEGLSLLGNDSSLPNVTSKIVCNVSSAFTLINISKVEIKALGFESCGRDTSELAASPQDHNRLLEDIGAVVPTISVVFVQHFDLTSCRMDSNYLPLYVYASALHSQNCEFTNNTGTYGGAVLAHSSTVEFTGQTLFRHNTATKNGGAMFVSSSDLEIRERAVFLNNKAGESAGGIIAFDSRIKFDENRCINPAGDWLCELGNPSIQFKGNSAELFGGALRLLNTSIVITVKTSFHGNSAINGGGIFVENGKLSFHTPTVFTNNHARNHGGGMLSLQSEITIGEESMTDPHPTGYSCNFSQNSAKYGAAIFIHRSYLLFSRNCIFTDNSGIRGAGIRAIKSIIQFHAHIVFRHNHPDDSGGAMYVTSSGVYFFDKATFQDNTVQAEGGGMSIAKNSTVHFEGFTEFIRNSAGTSGGGIYLQSSTLVIRNVTIFSRNTAQERGGGICLSGGSLNVRGLGVYTDNTAGISGGMVNIADGAVVTVTREQHFERNLATLGGAVSLDKDCKLSILASKYDQHIVFSGNQAVYGGAIFSDSGSNLTLKGTHRFADNVATYYVGFGGYGGAIYAVGTKLSLGGWLNYTNNTARYGGAIAVSQYDEARNFLILKETNIHFYRNYANKNGGAIFVEENLVINCGSNSSTTLQMKSSCFLKVTLACGTFCEYVQYPVQDLVDNQHAYFTFESNYAKEGGDKVFGGELENCIMYRADSSGIELLAALVREPVHSITAGLSSISSGPYKVCICDSNTSIPDCSQNTINRSVYPGQRVSFPAVAVGQANGVTPAVIHARFTEPDNAWLDQLQMTQSANMSCTLLVYTLFSRRHVTSTLQLFAAGPCEEAGVPLSIAVKFLPCPAGFGLAQSGVCTCHKRIQKYTNSCDIDDRTINRNRDFWLGYNAQGLILHPHCPFDYCKLETVSFTLNSTDRQCADGRSGILCGACKSGFSLNLGSSGCSNCSNVYLLLFLPLSTAGLLLVAFLFICKVTVAAGTTSGLIFYANVLAVNRSVFFPSSETNILTVFIAWLNLDLGIETCIISGMDIYTRTWMQFIFPFYIWILAGLITLASRYSMKFSRIIGPTNPISVLATLFLLSYTKLLRTIIATFSFTTLDYPNDRRVTVWVYDGNIGYLQGKHIPLFLAGLLAFLFLFLPYILVLLFGQCIEAGSNHRLLSWANNPKVRSFLDAYHAPYKNRHRYWAGLLLLLRFVLFIISAVVDINSPRDPSVNLLVLGTVCAGLMILSLNTAAGSVYKNWYKNALESSFILNLAILALASYQVKVEGGNQAAVVYASVSVAFVAFLGIITYHVVQQVLGSRLWRMSLRPKLQQFREKFSSPPQHLDNPTEMCVPPTAPPPTVTTTFVDLREPLIDSNRL